MILAYFGQNLVAIQKSLNPCNHKCLIWIGRPRKTHVIRNHIPVVSRRNAFIAILVPKSVAMVTPLWPLCKGVSRTNFPIAQTLSQNQTLHGYVACNWPFLLFFGLFWPNFGCHGNTPLSLVYLRVTDEFSDSTYPTFKTKPVSYTHLTLPTILRV